MNENRCNDSNPIYIVDGVKFWFDNDGYIQWEPVAIDDVSDPDRFGQSGAELVVPIKRQYEPEQVA
jgi:hypothetical protein